MAMVAKILSSSMLVVALSQGAVAAAATAAPATAPMASSHMGGSRHAAPGSASKGKPGKASKGRAGIKGRSHKVGKRGASHAKRGTEPTGGSSADHLSAIKI